jgi:hypothetical protein
VDHAILDGYLIRNFFPRYEDGKDGQNGNPSHRKQKDFPVDDIDDNDVLMIVVVVSSSSRRHDE